MARQLPSGVSEESFQAALAAFTEIVGEKWVVSREAELAKYADPYPVGADLAGGPSAVVSPASVEEVQAVVRAANKYGVPLSAVATGRTTATAGRRRGSREQSWLTPARR